MLSSTKEDRKVGPSSTPAGGSSGQIDGGKLKLPSRWMPTRSWPCPPRSSTKRMLDEGGSGGGRPANLTPMLARFPFTERQLTVPRFVNCPPLAPVTASTVPVGSSPAGPLCASKKYRRARSTQKVEGGG